MLWSSLFITRLITSNWVFFLIHLISCTCRHRSGLNCCLIVWTLPRIKRFCRAFCWAFLTNITDDLLSRAWFAVTRFAVIDFVYLEPVHPFKLDSCIVRGSQLIQCDCFIGFIDLSVPGTFRPTCILPWGKALIDVHDHDLRLVLDHGFHKGLVYIERLSQVSQEDVPFVLPNERLELFLEGRLDDRRGLDL